MKKLYFLLFVIFQSCNVFYNVNLKKDFSKEKPSLWKYDEKLKIYSSPIDIKATNMEDEVTIWKKYKDYLKDKDTTFILKEFGIPNKRDKNHFTYFTRPECLYSPTHKNEPRNYNCSYILFYFENYKLKQIVVIEENTRSDSY